MKGYHFRTGAGRRELTEPGGGIVPFFAPTEDEITGCAPCTGDRSGSIKVHYTGGTIKEEGVGRRTPFHAISPAAIARPSPPSRVILTVQDEDGHDEPVAVLASIFDAAAVAGEHYLHVINDKAASSLWPCRYTLWARDGNRYTPRAEWRP